jgi:hypothetical protein
VARRTSRGGRWACRCRSLRVRSVRLVREAGRVGGLSQEAGDDLAAVGRVVWHRLDMSDKTLPVFGLDRLALAKGAEAAQRRRRLPRSYPE